MPTVFVRVAVAVMVFIASAEAVGTEITTVNISSVSSQLTAHSRFATNLLNNVGLNTTTNVHSITREEMWLTDVNDLTPNIVFDLGTEVSSLRTVRIWNYNEDDSKANRGAKDAELFVSTDGATFTSAKNFTLAIGPATATDFHEDIDLGSDLAARFVKLYVSTNYGSSDYVGLSAVKFFLGETPVPATPIPPTPAPGTPAPTPAPTLRPPTPTPTTPVPATPVPTLFKGEEITPVHIGGVSSELEQYNRFATNLVNGRGLDASNPRHHSIVREDMWIGNTSDTNAWVVFDLNTPRPIQTMTVWNYNEAAGGKTDRGFNLTQVAVSNDGITFRTLMTVTLHIAPGSNTVDSGEDVLLPSLLTVRFIKLTALSTYGSALYAGLSEVKFYTASPTPTRAPERAFGPEFLGASIAHVTSELTQHDRFAANLLNDAKGLRGDGHSIVAEDMWIGRPGDLTPSVTIDIGRRAYVASLVLWNYNEADEGKVSRGVEEFKIAVSTDNNAFHTVSSGRLPRGPAAQDVPFGHAVHFTPAEARFVKISAISNYGHSDYTGLSKVKLYAPSVHGDEVVPSGVHAFSTQLTQHDRYAANTLGTKGLFLGGRHSIVREDMWIGTAGDLQAWVVYDLGSATSIGSMAVWNYNEVHDGKLSRGFRDTAISVSLNGTNFVPIANVTLTKGPGTHAQFGDNVLFQAPKTARYVKIAARSNFGDRSYSGLSKVRFYGAASLPDEVTSVRIAGVSSELTQYDRFAVNLLGNRGLRPNGFHSIVPENTMWIGQAGDLQAWVSFDLGAAYALAALKVWNYNELDEGKISRGFKQSEIYVAEDIAGPWRLFRTVELAIAPGSTTVDFSEVIRFAQPLRTRFLKLRAETTYGHPSYTGLSEVKFFAYGLATALPVTRVPSTPRPTQATPKPEPTRTPVTRSPTPAPPTTPAPFTAPPEILKGPLITPIGIANVSSELTAYDRFAVNLVNGRGLLSGRRHSIVREDMWIGEYRDTSAWVTFDLKSVRPVKSMTVWNYNEDDGGKTDRGMNDIEVLWSADGTIFRRVALVTLHKAPGVDDTAFAQDVAFPQTVSVRFITVRALSNHGSSGYTGLSEVQFNAPTELKEFTGVSIANVSSELTQYDRFARNLLNGKGLTGTFHSVVREDMWIGQYGDKDAWVIVDLGGVGDLREVRVWNYNEADGGKTDRGMKDYYLTTSVDGATFVEAAYGVLPQAPGSNSTDFSFGIAVDGTPCRYVKIKANSNYGGQYTGLSALKFFGTRIALAPAPQPTEAPLRTRIPAPPPTTATPPVATRPVPTRAVPATAEPPTRRPVKVITFGAKGTVDSFDREKLISDIARALDILREYIRLLRVRAGSVVVDVVIDTPDAAQAEAKGAELVTMLRQPDTPLAKQYEVTTVTVETVEIDDGLKKPATSTDADKNAVLYWAIPTAVAGALAVVIGVAVYVRSRRAGVPMSPAPSFSGPAKARKSVSSTDSAGGEDCLPTSAGKYVSSVDSVDLALPESHHDALAAVAKELSLGSPRESWGPLSAEPSETQSAGPGAGV